MTPVDLAKLKQVAEAATKESWAFERVGFDDGNFAYERNTKNTFIQISEENYTSPMYAKFDAEHIAAFNPVVALELLSRLEMAVSKKVDLTDADLTDANLTDADLTDANLTDADLTDANLRALGDL